MFETSYLSTAKPLFSGMGSPPEGTRPLRARILKNRITGTTYRHEYWTHTGYLHQLIVNDGSPTERRTIWDDNGVLRTQSEGGRMLDGPPWQWGAKNQEEASPPPWFQQDSMFK